MKTSVWSLPRPTITTSIISGAKRPWAVTQACRSSRRASARGSSTGPRKSAITPPSGLGGVFARLRLGATAASVVSGAKRGFERDWRAQTVNELVRGDDDDEATRCRGDDPLAGVRGAASLDQPAGGIDLVGAVDREVEAGDVVEWHDFSGHVSQRHWPSRARRRRMRHPEQIGRALGLERLPSSRFRGRRSSPAGSAAPPRERRRVSRQPRASVRPLEPRTLLASTTRAAIAASALWPQERGS
jgi:hypothetical protein